MTKSTGYTPDLNTIVNFVEQELRPRKFRKSGRRFNRILPDGIVHVIDFRMGPSWSILWGKFTVEIGVFLPEVFKALFEKVPPKFIPSYDCFERSRLGNLGKDEKDIWWDLQGDGKKIAGEVSGLLLGPGEIYFSRYGSREKCLSEWEQKRSQEALRPKQVLILAIIYAYLGEKERAEDLLAVEFGDKSNSAFIDYARNVVAPFGLVFPSLE